MTRQEVKDRAGLLFSGFTPEEVTAFPILLMHLAQYFFVYGESDYELATEVRNRLKELAETGTTSV